MSDMDRQDDGKVLAEFAETGSERAFAELMQRHGAMVDNVCRRVLRDHHDAEDATQAVFLALARKAKGIRGVLSVGAWLHVVAWRLAVNVRRDRQNRQAREVAAMREQEWMNGPDAERALFAQELDAAVRGHGGQTPFPTLCERGSLPPRARD